MSTSVPERPEDPVPADTPGEHLSVNLVALLATFRRLQRKLERLAARLAEMQDWVDEVAHAIESLVQDVYDQPNVVPRPRARRSPEEERRMREEARTGATATIDAQADGSGEIRLNGRDPFRLSRRLLSLLRVLIAGSPPESDGLPGWSTGSEVAAALTLDARRAVKPDGVARLMYKLRRAFSAAGENPFLIQTNRELGAWRVAVRVDQ
jgi:hypothetical protein